MVADVPLPPVPAVRVPAAAPAAQASQPPRVTCQQLMQGGRELEIEHAGAIYRLRITAMGKLILTK